MPDYHRYTHANVPDDAEIIGDIATEALEYAVQRAKDAGVQPECFVVALNARFASGNATTGMGTHMHEDLHPQAVIKHLTSCIESMVDSGALENASRAWEEARRDEA